MVGRDGSDIGGKVGSEIEGKVGIMSSGKDGRVICGKGLQIVPFPSTAVRIPPGLTKTELLRTTYSKLGSRQRSSAQFLQRTLSQ